MIYNFEAYISKIVLQNLPKNYFSLNILLKKSSIPKILMKRVIR